MHQTSIDFSARGKLAYIYCKKALPLEVLESAAGFYIGTSDMNGPLSRESLEYFRSSSEAQKALSGNLWTQRDEP